MKELLSQIKRSFLELVFPLDQQCMACNKEVKVTPPYLCHTCNEALEPMLFEHEKEIDVYKQVISGYLLNEAAKKMIHEHKYKHKRYLSHCLAHLLVDKIKTYPMKLDVITSVPSGKQRNRMRGCDHAYDIAVEVGALLDLPVVKMLERIHHEDAQAHLGRLERFNNMQSAFKRRSLKVQYLGVLLIDDVFTTGATMIAAAKCLEEEGRTLYGATVFYTPINQ